MLKSASVSRCGCMTSTNTSLQERRSRAIPRGLATATPFFISRAQNAEVWDVEERRLIDFASGIAVLNTGHCHSLIKAAAVAQLDRYAHAAFQVIGYEPYVELCERLNQLAPVKAPAKSILFSTGAEAVENAIKIARAATRRNAVIAFSGAFHGRSLFALSLTGKTNPYKNGFGILPGDVYRLPFPGTPQGITVEQSLAALEQIFRNDVPPERVAAIILEPVQGEGGFHPIPADLLHALRELCDKQGILLIADEIQTGFARTGKMFALEHYGVKADLLVVAKALGGGFPLSGVIGNATVMDAPEPGGLGGTYAGSPVACAAALAVLETIQTEGLCRRADELGVRARTKLQSLVGNSRFLPIGNIRGLGAMIAFDVLDTAGAAPVIKRAHTSGLIVLSCGMRTESIRLLFPLTASTALVDEGLELLAGALARN
jgi:4-aminobutyrate aminotransferase/(S)-3-amino-2-methylpropionate transaminase